MANFGTELLMTGASLREDRLDIGRWGGLGCRGLPVTGIYPPTGLG